MDQPVLITGTKGGVGCSVVATVLAYQLAQERPTVLVDASRGQSCAAIVGLAHEPDNGLWTEIAPNLHHVSAETFPTFNMARNERGPIVVDLGTHPKSEAAWLRLLDAAQATHITVTTGDYLALRQAVRHPWNAYTAGVIHIDEHGRSLGRSDIEDVLGVPVLCSIPHRSAVARAVDAGVLPTRMPDTLSRPVQHAALRLGLLGQVNA